jgi:hypothetical protein
VNLLATFFLLVLLLVEAALAASLGVMTALEVEGAAVALVSMLNGVAFLVTKVCRVEE